MKQVSPQRRMILILLAVCATFAAVLAGYRYETRYSEDALAVQEAVVGAHNAMGMVGGYDSPDGLTSSLSTAELYAQMDAYSRRINRYYARENPVYERYKANNRYVLSTWCKTKVEQMTDSGGGIYQLYWKGVTFRKGRTEATFAGTVYGWGKGVEVNETTGKYQGIPNPAGLTYLRVDLIKEDGFWKVLRISDCEPLSVWGCDNVVKDGVSNSFKVCWNKSPEAARCWAEIRKNEAILARQYDTYQEAKNAVDSMDLEHGNYYALAKLCRVNLLGVRNAP